MCNSRSLAIGGRQIGRGARIAGLFLLLNAAAASQISAAAALQSFVSVTTRNGDHTFTEFTDSEFILNQEQGRIEHLGLNGRWQFHNGVFLQAGADRGSGAIAYGGYTQSLNYREYTTEYLLTEQYLRLGRDFGNHSAYISIGNRYRERNIIDGNLYEELDWRYGAFGLGKHFKMGERWQINFSAELSMALDSRLRAEFSGLYEPVELAPGQLLSGRGGAELMFKFTPKFAISGGPLYEFTRIKASDGGSNIDAQSAATQPFTEYESLFWQVKLSKFF